MLISLDDVAMQDNQCDCDKLFDVSRSTRWCSGWSVRMQGNRFKESLLHYVPVRPDHGPVQRHQP